MSETRCASCGYTEADAKFNGDHRLCKNDGNAPWQKGPNPTPVPAQQRCPGCDEYGASHTTPSIEHPAVPAQLTEAECGTCEQSIVREPHDPLYGPGKWRHVKPYAGDAHSAVPAQEAPRESECECGRTGPFDQGNKCGCPCHAEPQAGAQELFPGANDMRAPTGMENLRDTPPIVYEGNMAFAQFVGVIEEAEQAGAQVPSQDVKCLQAPYDPLNLRNRSYIWPQEIPAIADRYEDLESAHAKLAEMYSRELQRWVDAMAALRSIRAYATEAAKTSVTREDMHDPLKAQTFYDEAKGFERLVLSEIGGGK